MFDELASFRDIEKRGYGSSHFVHCSYHHVWWKVEEKHSTADCSFSLFPFLQASREIRKVAKKTPENARPGCRLSIEE
jgi:hypothetical protein